MKKEMNNKGFSLVELIIVIAIMVILVAVLAPQYLRYVEKSRISTDTQTMVEYINAMQVIASDPDAGQYIAGTTHYEVTVDGTDGSIDASSLVPVLGASGLAVLDDAAFNAHVQSTAYRTASPSIVINLDYDSTSHLWNLTTIGINTDGSLPSTNS